MKKLKRGMRCRPVGSEWFAHRRDARKAKKKSAKRRSERQNEKMRKQQKWRTMTMKEQTLQEMK